MDPLRKLLENILSKIDISQWKDVVVTELKEITWKEIKKTIVTKNLPLTSKSASILVSKSDRFRTKEEIIKIIQCLTLKGVATNHARRKWTSFQLTGSTRHNNIFSLEKLISDLNRKIHLYNCQREVGVLLHNNLIWIGFFKTTSKNRKTCIVSNFIAYEWGTNAFLVNNPVISKMVLKTVAESLGYETVSKKNLEGNDVYSLYKLIHFKSCEAIGGHAVLEKKKVSYRKQPVSRNGVVDFINTKGKENYMEKLYGKNPPSLSSFSIKASGVSLESSSIPKLAGKKFSITCTIKSKNVFRSIQNMVESGAITDPNVPWVTKAMSLGKNFVNLEPNPE